MKVFLELKFKSIVSYLAYDNNAVQEVLKPENEVYFSDKFPVFYRNEEGKSAIDTALDANQIRSVNVMIEYMCRFQNKWVFANLFDNNLVTLISKGVTLSPLFESDIFQHKIEYAEWPSAHRDTTKKLKPYDESLFDLRFAY